MPANEKSNTFSSKQKIRKFTGTRVILLAYGADIDDGFVRWKNASSALVFDMRICLAFIL